jgi:hypothetical protein
VYETIGLVSGIITIAGLLPYLRDIFRKTTKPERATWFIWMILGSIAFFSQLAKGATSSLWMTGVDTLAITIIFLLSIHYGVGGLAKRDIIALLVAFFGLVLWFFTKDAALALFLVILVDVSGSYLTIVKAHEDPGSETLISWFLAGLAGLLSAISVGSFNWILLSYPFYICLANWAVVAAMILGKRKSSK